jgi:two-component system response regulator RegA
MSTETSPPPYDRPTLLLVDEDPVFCRVLGDALGKRNYEVYIAHDLTTALRLARERQPESLP